MNMIKTVRIALSAATTAAILAATGVSAHGADAKISIAVVAGTLDGMLPILGQSQGIFKKYGLDATMITVKNGPELIAALASGSAEFAEAAPAIALPAIAKGATISFLMNNYDLDYSLIARADSKINTSLGYPEIGKELRGLRVGVVGRGGVTELFVRKILADSGLDPDTDVTIIAVGAGASAVGAFQNDQVDAMVSLPPMEFIIGDGGYKEIVSNTNAREKVFGPDYILTTMAGNSEFIKDNPEVTLNYCRAFQNTVDFLHEATNRPIVTTFIMSHMNLDEAQAGAMFDRYNTNWNTRLTRDRWTALQKTREGVPSWEKQVYEPCASLTAN